MSLPKRFAMPFDDCRLLLQTFDEYLVGFLKRVGKDRTYSTYEDYCLRRRRLAALHEYEYHVKNISFKEQKRDFIEKIVVYLSTVKGLASGTICAGGKKLRLMTYTAYIRTGRFPPILSPGSMSGPNTPNGVICPLRNCRPSWTQNYPTTKQVSTGMSSSSALLRA